jgi:hypothetical protein
LFAQSAAAPQRRSWAPQALGAAVLVLAVVVHSPWITNKRFRQHLGMVAAGQRVAQLCSPHGRVATGPGAPQPIIHYAQREGWAWVESPLPHWQTLFAQFQAVGGEYVVLYFEGENAERKRETLAPMIAGLKLLEHRCDPGSSMVYPYEYFILKLSGTALQGSGVEEAKRSPVRER